MPIPITEAYAVQVLPTTGSGASLGPDYAGITRPAYLALYGVSAPPYDNTHPIQTYKFSGPTPTTCFAPENAAGGYVEQFTPMPDANLPGPYPYPVYVIAPTQATIPFGTSTLDIPANYICSQGAAQAFQAAVQAVLPEGMQAELVEGTFYPGANWGPFTDGSVETRRDWGLKLTGSGSATYPGTITPANIGNELQNINAEGVGYPGGFNAVAPGAGNLPYVYVFSSPVIDAAPDAQVAPIPLNLPFGYQVALDPGSGLFTGASYVVQPIPSPSSPAPSVTLAQVQAVVAAYNAQAGVAPISIQG
jgi:hypothetical protein